MAKTKVEIKTPDFDKWKLAVQELTDKVGLAIEQQARATAPRSQGETNSAHYMDRINYYPDSKTVIAEQSYSAAIEYGTAAHEIKPVTAQALHFKQNGKDVFYKKVYHKGTKPNPVMRNAAAQTQKEIPQIWQEVQRENGL